MTRARISRILAAAASLSLATAEIFAQTQADPHRPACTSAVCENVRKYVKAHYCGKSPFGEGPDDSCDILRPTRPQLGVIVTAEFKCAWNDMAQAQKCTQRGEPSGKVRNLLIDELRRRGLPSTFTNHIYFLVWKSVRSNWTLVEAYYSKTKGSELHLCDVLGILDAKSHLSVLRSNRFQKTDLDKPEVTQWTPLDIVDATGGGAEDIVLQADAYQNRWLEVISVRAGAPKTIFSGLGYYL